METKADVSRDAAKQNIIQTLQQSEAGTTTIIDGTAITRYVTATPPSADQNQKKLQMRGSKLFKMSSRPFLVTDTQQKIKLEDVDKDKTQTVDRRVSTSGSSTLPSNSYFLTPITSAVQLKNSADNDNKGAVSLAEAIQMKNVHGQKIKVNFLVKDGDNKGINIAQNQIVQASQGNVQTLAGDKRIIYTSVLNVKALPKNNGEASEPQTSNGLHMETTNDGQELLNARGIKNKTILRTSLHSSPVGGATTTGGIYSVNNRYNLVKISGTKNDKNLNNKTQSPNNNNNNNNNNARSNTYAYIKPDANKNIVIVQNFNCNNLKHENNGANKSKQKKETIEERSDDDKYANVNGNERRTVNKTQKQEEENDSLEKNISDNSTSFPAKRKSINQKKTEHKSKIAKESADEQINTKNNNNNSASPKTTDHNG